MQLNVSPVAWPCLPTLVIGLAGLSLLLQPSLIAP